MVILVLNESNFLIQNQYLYVVHFWRFKIRYQLILTFGLILFITPNLKAQSFVNPDLDGIITGFSNLPTGWQSVPYTDPACIASSFSYATPDLISLTLPDSSIGIIGNPYSGNTFASGGQTLSPSTNSWHEGIMQNVGGFTIGHSYKINFQQSVVKQLGVEDNSGSWMVYLDSTLIGITVPTHSTDSIRSTSFKWEERDIYFTATRTFYMIKFLPWDDDPNILHSIGDTTGALRMGIDSINLSF